MKNGLLILLGCFFASSLSLASQTKDHGVLANIATVAMGNYEVSYEQRLDKRFSISASAIYYESRVVLWRVFSRGYFLGLGIIPKFHLFGDAHKNSFYLAPSLRLGYVDHPPSDPSEKPDSGLLYRFGPNFGYQHVFDSGFMIDLMSGVELYYQFSFTKAPDRFQTSKERPRFELRPYISAAIGYAF